MILNDATKRQMNAARPAQSTWLTANAGSGKTRVLTDRVARLLLSGVQPQRILCLTYTTAAASEMQNRLFKRLGEWTMLPKGRLAEQLQNLGEPGPFPDETIAAARTLFASAIETPGGLKIQTIHSFCAAILRRFPLEAGVTPQFREMDDRLSKLMQREILEEMAQEGDPGFQSMVAEQSADDLPAWLDGLIALKQPLSMPHKRDEIWSVFDLPPHYDFNAHVGACLQPGDDELLAQVAFKLESSGANDQKAAAKLSMISLDPPTPADLTALEGVLVFGHTTKDPNTAKIKSFPTKAGRALLDPDELSALHDLMERMAEAKPRRLSLISARRTAALHEFASAFLARFEARKAQGGWLDFDDLIDRTDALLGQSNMAAWVLYRLDGGIDHVLVDEAQDTSPKQWRVIRQLTDEITSGEGVRPDVPRTVFVVGDKKQSIYSFQGADPRAFDEMEAYYNETLSESSTPLQRLPLEHSFRSAPAILTVVDRVFEMSDGAGLGQNSHHIAFKDALPGRVDVLEPTEKVEPVESGHWTDTVDLISDTDERRQLAQGIAQRINGMIGSAVIPVEEHGIRKDRIVQPKDILILVQKRSGIFNEIIRACKSIGIPMAGADRMNVAQELAVKDITALLSFLATPEDDLALASALKSPLLGWDEQGLFELAYHRTGAYLWPALRDRAGDFPETVKLLQDLLGRTDFLRPFELIDRLLTSHNGRRRIIARLGPEAEDAIDALLGQALAYEQTEVPSLTGFLTWLSADDLKIKRATDSGANVVRVMTVHGAKGLESPIVILPETAKRRSPQVKPIGMVGDLPVWFPNADDQADVLRAQRESDKALWKEEQQRLLYVAMTRAEVWLILAATHDVGAEQDSWYSQIAEAQGGLPATPILGGMRYEPMGWPTEGVQEGKDAAAKMVQLNLPAPAATTIAPKPITPSELGGAKTFGISEEDPDAMARGTAIHALLERCPDMSPSLWADTAQSEADKAGVDADDILTEVQRVLNSQTLEHLFVPGTLAEVPLTAALPELKDQRLRGIVDRLVITPERVLAVDYKTNQNVSDLAEDVPEGLLRQMGAYRAALLQIYEDRPVETAILWTKTATLVVLPQEYVMAALERASMG